MSQHFAVTGILIHDPAIRRQAVHRADVAYFSLVSKLQRHARSAIESYSDDELASLIGTKRMSDALQNQADVPALRGYRHPDT
jgi:hypothetical protein